MLSKGLRVFAEGMEVPGVQHIQFTATAGEAVRVEMTLYCFFSMSGTDIHLTREMRAPRPEQIAPGRALSFEQEP